ncbi:hypothetical protein V8C37DRAFT_384185 [Trichoderma ceciliae]
MRREFFLLLFIFCLLMIYIYLKYSITGSAKEERRQCVSNVLSCPLTAAHSITHKLVSHNQSKPGTQSNPSIHKYIKQQNMPQSQPHAKEEKIAQAQANLPLPEQPPKASDWQSADARTTGVGSGRFSGGVGTDSGAEAGLREPATKGSEEVDMGKIGRENQ